MAINFSRLCESYIYFIPKIKKQVNALGKISAHADDNRDIFLSGLRVCSHQKCKCPRCADTEARVKVAHFLFLMHALCLHLLLLHKFCSVSLGKQVMMQMQFKDRDHHACANSLHAYASCFTCIPTVNALVSAFASLL